jgi:hypothetical protein
MFIRIPDPRQKSNLTQKIVSKLLEICMIRVVHPGSGSRFLPIPDPGVNKASDPDPDLQLCYLRDSCSNMLLLTSRNVVVVSVTSFDLCYFFVSAFNRSAKCSLCANLFSIFRIPAVTYYCLRLKMRCCLCNTL